MSAADLALLMTAGTLTAGYFVINGIQLVRHRRRARDEQILEQALRVVLDYEARLTK
jgi:hypothetical protein